MPPAIRKKLLPFITESVQNIASLKKGGGEQEEEQWVSRQSVSKRCAGRTKSCK
jgi:hypothetical protein